MGWRASTLAGVMVVVLLGLGQVVMAQSADAAAPFSLNALLSKYTYEAIAILVLMMYSLNMLVGSRENLSIVREFCSAFTEGENCLYARNFAVHGTLGEIAAGLCLYDGAWCT